MLSNAFAGKASSEPVHAAIPAGVPSPLLFEKEEELTGIVPEYTQAIIDILGRGGDLSLLPRNRLTNYLHSGKVDFLCYTSKEWASDDESFLWTKPFFVKRDVILGPAPMPKSPKELKGKTIGTMLAYTYPKLDSLFQDKTLVREDGPNEESNLNKLRNEHISYLVIDEIFLDFYKKSHPSIEARRERMFLQQYPVSCSLSRKGHVTQKELEKALLKLKTSGKLDEIFRKYGSEVRE